MALPSTFIDYTVHDIEMPDLSGNKHNGVSVVSV